MPLSADSTALPTLPTYSIVIPCYRSGKWLPALIRRICDTMDRQDASFEILLINDASPDDTWHVIEDICRQNPRVRGVDLMFNTGQYRATLCGLEQARGELIITMDDDLEHRPEDLPLLVGALGEHPELDCVMGHLVSKSHSLFRRVCSRFVAWLYVHLYGKPRKLQPSAFLIMRRRLAETMSQHGTIYFTPALMIYGSTRRIANVDVTHGERPGGGSSHSITSFVKIVFNNFFAASTLPLRAMAVFGTCCAVGSAAMAVYYLYYHLFIQRFSQPGFATLVLLVLFFGGTTLFSIGLVGEYLLRLMQESRRPPRYAIRTTIGGAGVPHEMQDCVTTDRQA